VEWEQAQRWAYGRARLVGLDAGDGLHVHAQAGGLGADGMKCLGGEVGGDPFALGYGEFLLIRRGWQFLFL
jgi:hypothetical protein